jgi:flagellar P-ring protein FlgI
MKWTIKPALVALAVITWAVSTATATSRTKDLANIEGIRQDQLIGYGLVVGVNGTDDTLNKPFTTQSLQGMLEPLSVNSHDQQIRTGNVAAVIVTANVPPFAIQGTRMDHTASALGDADGNVYAVAQGSLANGGFQVHGEVAR